MSRLRRILIITTIIFLLLSINILSILIYIANRKYDDLNTAGELERSLCSCKEMKKKQEWREQRCPPNGFVTLKPGARLGNKMWQYISVWGVARRIGLKGYIPKCLRLELSNAFDSLTTPVLDDISQCSVNISKFANSLEEWNYSYQGLMIRSNAFMIEVALVWVEDVKKEFTFRKDIVEQSQDILRTFVNNSTDKVFVGVHVRRTDYSGYLRGKYSLKYANVSFYYSAMKYYEDKYKDVAFIMTSDDSKWCIEEFSNKSNVFVVGKLFKNSAFLDLAVLAACNHSIFDYGTYGGWSAILAGGETVFYKIEGDFTERLAKLLPNWHAIR